MNAHEMKNSISDEIELAKNTGLRRDQRNVVDNWLQNEARRYFINVHPGTCIHVPQSDVNELGIPHDKLQRYLAYLGYVVLPCKKADAGYAAFNLQLPS